MTLQNGPSGSGTGANPVIISRIIGGDPMGATQMNTGRDAEELIQAGLMLDLTDIANELTQLIQTQRAYSSNAKIIQTVDEMLQETTNLKR